MPSSLIKEILFATVILVYTLKMKRNYIYVLLTGREVQIRRYLPKYVDKSPVLGLYLVNLPLLSTLRIVSAYQLAHYIYGSRN